MATEGGSRHSLEDMVSVRSIMGLSRVFVCLSLANRESFTFLYSPPPSLYSLSLLLFWSDLVTVLVTGLCTYHSCLLPNSPLCTNSSQTSLPCISRRAFVRCAWRGRYPPSYHPLLLSKQVRYLRTACRYIGDKMLRYPVRQSTPNCLKTSTVQPEPTASPWTTRHRHCAAQKEIAVPIYRPYPATSRHKM